MRTTSKTALLSGLLAGLLTTLLTGAVNGQDLAWIDRASRQDATAGSLCRGARWGVARPEWVGGGQFEEKRCRALSERVGIRAWNSISGVESAPR